MPEALKTASDTRWLTVLRISGDDRVSFLQGQLTQDIALLSADRPVALAASCDAKGRVLAVLTLIYTPDMLYAVLRRDIAEAWVQHVLRYRLRAKVEITLCDDVSLTASDPDTTLFDPRQPDNRAGATMDSSDVQRWQLGHVTEHLQASPAPDIALDDLHWRKARLQAGVADIGPDSSGSFTPHMLNLDRLGAISFRKGCYTGQEVVARTEHLGAVKRRAWLVRSADEMPLTDGDSVIANARAVGRVAVAAGNLALAVLTNDAASLPLTLEDGRALIREV